MIHTDNMSSQDAVREQYKTTDNLKLRKSLHEKYSVNQTGFQKWMFGRYPFRPGMKILELGSGRGELWDYYFENATLQEYEMDITVSDVSDGMTEHLRQRFSGREMTVRKIDILDIPFGEESFDLVIANSMLYHVKDIDLALSEVRRVLKRDGFFYCATLGVNGMTRYLYHALDELGIPGYHDPDISFTLQNGAGLLGKHFSRVERSDYEDALEIDDIRDYMEYIYSMASMEALRGKIAEKLKSTLLVAPTVRLVEPGGIERAVGKAKHVDDQRAK